MDGVIEDIAADHHLPVVILHIRETILEIKFRYQFEAEVSSRKCMGIIYRGQTVCANSTAPRENASSRRGSAGIKARSIVWPDSLEISSR